MQLRVAVVTREAEVIAATASLKRNSTEAGGVPVNAQVTQLPFNGQWISQMALVPDAINLGAGTQKTIRLVGHGVDGTTIVSMEWTRLASRAGAITSTCRADIE